MRYLLATLLATSLSAAEIASLPFTPATEWKADSRSGDKVTLADQDEILAVHYDVSVDGTHQIGHRTFNQVSFRVLLKHAVPMTEQQRRIIFEAAGLDSHARNPNAC